MTISPQTIKDLREVTGAGVMDVKQALQEANGDVAAATDLLRKRGQKVAAKKAGRETREGVIGTYVHANGKVAAMVALACETDFVARNAAFQELAHDLALHIAAADPQYLKPEDVPADVLEHERGIARDQAAESKKPAAVVEKIVDGKVAKFLDEQCLLRQAFVKDDQRTIGELIDEATAKIGEKIEVRSFTRFAL